MALLDTNDTIKEYWEEVKDQYPHLNFQQFQSTCKYPFTFFKKKMSEEGKPDIYLKYFGKFKVKIGIIGKLIKKAITDERFRLRSIQERFDNNVLTEEQYNEAKEKITTRYSGYKENLQQLLEIKRKDDEERNAKRNTNKS